MSIEDLIHQSVLESMRLRLKARKDIEPETVKNDAGSGGARDINQLDADELSNEELELFCRFYDLISRLNDAIKNKTDLKTLLESFKSFINDNVTDVEMERKYQRSVDVIRNQIQTLGYGLETYARYLKTDKVNKQDELRQKLLKIIEKWLS